MVQRRRNYFIKKEFQVKFILKFCFLIVVACFLMGGLVYFLSASTITTSFENLRLVVKSTKDFILPALLLSSIIAIILISLACILTVLFISHRIAGPLYRLERSMEKIAGGDLTLDTRLRKTDELKAIANSLNDLVSKLRESIEKSQKIIEELDKEEALKPYQAKLKKLRDSLSYFKTE